MLIFAGSMWWLSQHYPIYSWNVNTQIFGIIIIIIGGLIDLSSLVLFLFSKTTVNPIKPEKAAVFVNKGMYQFSRNPMYLGLLLLLTGWAFYLAALSSLFLIPLFVVVINVMQIHHEEEVLEQKFGQPYIEYKNSVRRWL